MNIFHAFERGNFVLIAVFLLLTCMSIVSWYIIFRKAILIRYERRNLADFRVKFMKNPDLLLSSLGHGHGGAVSYIIEEVRGLDMTIKMLNQSEKKEVLSVHLVQVLDIIKVRLDSGLTILASISSSAPFVGLFGTVWGIYGALMDISTKGSAGLSVVAAPMGEALVATAVGLFAAIPAVLAYNTFVRFNRLILQDLRHISEQFSIYIPSRNFR